MATRIPDLIAWFRVGVESGASHMIVVCDTFDYDDYPVYVRPDEDFWERHDQFGGRNMQNVMEVYDLNMDMDTQMAEVRAHHEPPRPTRDTVEP